MNAAAIEFVLGWRWWIYAGLLVLGGIYARRFWLAYDAVQRTPFGLEKEAARRRQDTALAMLTIVLGIGVGVQLLASFRSAGLARQVSQSVLPTATPAPTPTPVVAPGPLVVDSSGCANPSATLTEPQAGARISGVYEVRGTASLPDFAFYKFEMSGQATSGVWVPLYVGNKPVTDDVLGSFDSNAYASGEYAFRLVVMDSAGGYPPPCVVPVSLVNLTGLETPQP